MFTSYENKHINMKTLLGSNYPFIYEPFVLAVTS
jgi:hypothetical protein